MEQERPRSDLSINSRNDLRKVLHLEFLHKDNKVLTGYCRLLVPSGLNWALSHLSLGMAGSPPGLRPQIPGVSLVSSL